HLYRRSAGGAALPYPGALRQCRAMAGPPGPHQGHQEAMTITLSVNGVAHRLEIDPATPLLYVLRGELGLHGAQFGCRLGRCGTHMRILRAIRRASDTLKAATAGSREASR